MSSCGASLLKSAFDRSSQTPAPMRAFSEEALSRYCTGGYHPVRIGDVFNGGRYKVLRKLGHGAYSTVWLACDLKTNQHVALKILTAESYGNGHDTFELDILRHIRTLDTSHPGVDHILSLLNEFGHRGPNGNHMCLVAKPMGPDMIKCRRLFPKARIPLPMVKKIAARLLLALDFLHDKCGIIHTDIKPQNILLETPLIDKMFEHARSEVFTSKLPSLAPPNDFYRPSEQLSSGEEDLATATDISVRLADFGTASWTDKHLTDWIQPQMLRAPEVILGVEWDSKVDIWNAGQNIPLSTTTTTAIWELAEGSLVFDGTWTSTAPYTAEAHLAQMEAVLGRMPKSLLARSKHRDLFFDHEDKLLSPTTFPPSPLERISQNPQLSAAEKTSFLDFIQSMVKLDPEERLSAGKLLDAQWLKSA
ncbi:kinase-like domain-containing protein [Immersiella caudata]|uniref:non-specific serine/threonine protein kinase n=1 Tax=Immersiella caudata TaxID=314043 RepID=A0AA39U5W7_9PEZI|nr:kinase-like domain-containing protein [Immersiella caudata]